MTSEHVYLVGQGFIFFPKALARLGPLYFHKKYGVILSITWTYDIYHVLYHMTVVSTGNTVFSCIITY